MSHRSHTLLILAKAGIQACYRKALWLLQESLGPDFRRDERVEG